MPQCLETEVGGYQLEITGAEFAMPSTLKNQPQWPKSLETYNRASVRRSTDATYYPIPRCKIQSDYYELVHTSRRKTWLNYPKMSAPTKGLTFYFVQTSQAAQAKCADVPDLACKMLEKIADMLIAVATAFQNEYIYYDLSQYPLAAKLMNLYARVIHLSARYMMTFEDAYHTGFFEYPGAVFSPFEVYVNTHYKRYQAHLQSLLTLYEDIQYTMKQKGGEMYGARKAVEK